MKKVEYSPIELTNAEKLSSILTKIDQEETRPANFRKSFIDVLEQFELNSLTEDTSQMRKLKNILAIMNKDMQEQVVSFVKENRNNLKNIHLNKFNKFKLCIETIMEFNKDAVEEKSNYKLVNFMKKTIRSMSKEYPNIIKNNVYNFEEDEGPIEEYAEQKKYVKRSDYTHKHWGFSDKHRVDLFNSIKKHYTEFQRFYNDQQTTMLMNKMGEKINDICELSENTLLYSPIEIMNKNKSKSKTNSDSSNSKTNESIEGEHTHSYSVFDLDLTTMLFNFYFLSIFTDLISLQDDTEILQQPLLKTQENQDEQNEETIFMANEDNIDILVGNKSELADKIANIIIVFTDIVCKDKKAINYNYQQLSELLLRSKEKEKDDMTSQLENETDAEREIDTFFKQHKLGKWSIGEQKGFRNYDKKTYEQERETMEKMASREANSNNRNIVTEMNRDIFELDMIAEEEVDDRIDREENMITYMGEDAEPEEYGMDGDENY
jgi:hypothetical protein